MTAIVFLVSLGRYAAFHDGAVREIAGRYLWANADELRDHAKAEGVPLSGLTIDTRWQQHGPLP